MDFSNKTTQRELAALICLSVATYIGCRTYPRTGILNWIKGDTEMSFPPSLIAGVIALMLVIPIVRGDFLHNHKLDPLNLATLFLAFVVATILVRVGLGQPKSLISVPTTYFAMAVLLLSNLNPKRYGELAIIGLVLCSTANLIAASNAMEGWGFALLITATVGSALVVDMKKIANRAMGTPD